MNVDAGWFLKWDAVEELLRELGFRNKVLEYVGRATREVADSEDLDEFLQFCRCWPSEPKQNLAKAYSSTWQVLAAVSAFPEAIQKHRARGVPWEITCCTLLDLQRRIEEYFAREEEWGFDKLSWMRNHVGGKFFEIGRLQYAHGTFGHLFRIYRNSETGAVTPLALSGRRCTSEGWPVANAGGFVTRLEEKTDGIHGHPASPKDGSISPTLTKLPPDSPVLLNDASSVAHIHIPTGEKLSRKACCESLRAAKEFFETYFPETPFRGFCTSTWLLDPEMAEVLPASSNIVSFGRLFHLLALNDGDDHQLLERVFGREATWENCAPKNSLQKAVLEHHKKDGQFRTTAGFILAEEMESIDL